MQSLMEQVFGVAGCCISSRSIEAFPAVQWTKASGGPFPPVDMPLLAPPLLVWGSDPPEGSWEQNGLLSRVVSQLLGTASAFLVGFQQIKMSEWVSEWTSVDEVSLSHTSGKPFQRTAKVRAAKNSFCVLLLRPFPLEWTERALNFNFTQTAAWWAVGMVAWCCGHGICHLVKFI